ncbi:hypothetical protein RJ639_024627, partial [Escallonia herrerae]
LAKVDLVLTVPKPTVKEDTDPKNFEKEFSILETLDKICKSMILNSLSNELCDIYCSRAHAYDIWDMLSKKYVIEDADTKKYAIDSFLQFQMLEEKDVSSQIHEFHLVVVELSKEEMPPLEPFVTGSLIEKLPESWSDYKSMMKHKRKDMTLEDVIVQIRIEEKNKSREKATKAKEFTLKANLIEERHDRPHGNYKRQNNRFGRYYTAQCRFRKGSDNHALLRAHLAEAANVIVAVIFEANNVTEEKAWVVDTVLNPANRPESWQRQSTRGPTYSLSEPKGLAITCLHEER